MSPRPAQPFVLALMAMWPMYTTPGAASTYITDWMDHVTFRENFQATAGCTPSAGVLDMFNADTDTTGTTLAVARTTTMAMNTTVTTAVTDIAGSI
jgi:hypothetical protein